jgi:hypothetical protein
MTDSLWTAPLKIGDHETPSRYLGVIAPVSPFALDRLRAP